MPARINNNYELLTGNQIGALLADFLLEAHKAELTPATTVLKTVVTGELGAVLARAKGCQVVETLTGFKYIGAKMTAYEQDPAHDFFFGYEESYGCLVGTYAQDKDAVGAALLVAEMAACYKKQGQTLCDRLNALYRAYGYYYDAQASYKLQGIAGKEKIKAIMDTLRAESKEPSGTAGSATGAVSGGQQNTELPGAVSGGQQNSELPGAIESSGTTGVAAFWRQGDAPAEVLDYAKGIADLPATNLLKYRFKNGSWLAIRPSGTEPKLKLYCSLVEKDERTAKAKFAALQSAFEQRFGL